MPSSSLAGVAPGLDIMWFEEPVAVGTMIVKPWPMYVRIGKIPVTAGQKRSPPRAGFAGTLMLEGAIDFCNFDASWGGGPH